MHQRSSLHSFLHIVLLSFVCACADTEPGAAGEPCNFDAEGTDGCDAVSICISGTCHKVCSAESASSPECGGGACSTWQRTYTGDSFTACQDPTGGGAGPSGAGSSGGPDCSSSCPSTCTGNVPEQACYYCQAACLCRCAGDQACASQNAAAACDLGTCGC